MAIPGSSPFAVASDRRSGRSVAALLAMGISRAEKSESHLVWRVCFHKAHRSGIRKLRAAAETPTKEEGGAEAAASAARPRGRTGPTCRVHAEGTQWIAMRVDEPRKYDSMVSWCTKTLGSIDSWTVLPYKAILVESDNEKADGEGAALGADDSGAAGSTASAPGPAMKRPAPASSQGQVVASAAKAAVAASAAGPVHRRHPGTTHIVCHSRALG